jgi:omega-amidase
MPDIKKVAIAQISAKAGDLDYNLKKVMHIIRKNADADIVLFPELILQGHHHKPSKEYYSQSVDVGTLEKIQEVCKDCDAAAVVGGLEIVEGNHYNCAFYIDENKIDRYIKTHVHWTEQFTPGDQLRCINTRMGKLGMMICFDSAYPEVGRCLALMGARIFAVIGAVPSAFNEKYMTNRLKALATNNQAFVLYANKWKRGKFNGGSCIIDPHGRILRKLGDRQGILRGKIDMDVAESWRNEEKIYQYRRPELYGRILKP